jgi:hypothetical protein
MINPHDPTKPGGYTDWKDHAQKYGDWGGFQNTTHFGSAKPFTLPPAQNPTYGSSGNTSLGSTVPYSSPNSITGTPSIASGGVSYGRRSSGAGLLDDLHPFKWAMAGCVIGLLACFLSQRNAPDYAGAAIAGLVGFPLLALGLRIATLLLMGLVWLFQLALKVAVVLGIIWIGWSLIQKAPRAVLVSPPAPGATPGWHSREWAGPNAAVSPVPRAILINPYPKH